MKTISLTVVIDETAEPMAERVVMGAMKGIMPSIRRVAVNTTYEVYDGAVWADEEKGGKQR